MTLPLKTRVLKYAIDAGKPITVSDIMRDLESEYGGEKQFTKKRIEEYIDSFLGVKFMKADKVEFNGAGQLVIYCSVTDYGMSRERFIPGYKK